MLYALLNHLEFCQNLSFLTRYLVYEFCENAASFDYGKDKLAPSIRALFIVLYCGLNAVILLAGMPSIAESFYQSCLSGPSDLAASTFEDVINFIKLTAL